jgi:formylglycine-generating enzyme required for sulfatase activity
MSRGSRGRRWLLSSCGAEGEAQEFLSVARDLERQGEPRLAATAYDRAYALASEDTAIAAERGALLDRLAVIEHGLTFRYVPAGSFLMGDAHGEPDERPIHIVELGDYWLSETPISWAAYCDLLGWEPPPLGYPKQAPQQEPATPPPRSEVSKRSGTSQQKSYSASDITFKLPNREFRLNLMNRIRLQYCEDGTLRAYDWHAHVPNHNWGLFGRPEREDPDRPWGYTLKPMVAIGWPEAEELGVQLSTASVAYGLPTEAEWEKAARGGLIDRRYPWGDGPPTPDRCDCDRFEQFSILPMRRFPPNGYGLYAMSGSVWEWTRDWYDGASYADSPPANPSGPDTGSEKVMRGGSWADCPEVLRVSFRASYPADTQIDQPRGMSGTPNIGFRLCRSERRMPS